jgi:hypothetical protein
VNVRIARWLLRRQKTWLQKQAVGVSDYERRRSLELDHIVKALEALG